MERTYRLPWPISANSRMGVVNGRQILSSAARKWFDLAAEELMLQRPEAIKGPVELSIQLCSPTKRRFDIDNRAKVTIDALVKHGIIEGDDNTIVKKLTLEVIDNAEPGGAYVTIRSKVTEEGA